MVDDAPVELRRLASRARLSVLCPPGRVADEVASRLERLAVGVDGLRLGPGEWLFEAEPELESELQGELRSGLAGLVVDVQNVAQALDGWQLQGPSSEVFGLLAQGANLQPVLGATGRQGARLLLGPFFAVVVVLRPAGPAIVDVQVDRSYADSLGVWLRLRLGRTAGSSGGGIGSRGAGG